MVCHTLSPLATSVSPPFLRRPFPRMPPYHANLGEYEHLIATVARIPEYSRANEIKLSQVDADLTLVSSCSGHVAPPGLTYPVPRLRLIYGASNPQAQRPPTTYSVSHQLMTWPCSLGFALSNAITNAFVAGQCRRLLLISERTRYTSVIPRSCPFQH